MSQIGFVNKFKCFQLIILSKVYYYVFTNFD